MLSVIKLIKIYVEYPLTDIFTIDCIFFSTKKLQLILIASLGKFYESDHNR